MVSFVPSSHLTTPLALAATVSDKSASCPSVAARDSLFVVPVHSVFVRPITLPVWIVPPWIRVVSFGFEDAPTWSSVLTVAFSAVTSPLWNFTPPMLLWAFPVVVTAPFSIFTDPIVLFVTRLVPVILPPSCNPTPWMESIYLGFPSSSNTESHCTIPAVFVFNCLTFTASKSFSPAFTLVIRRWSGELLVLAALPTEIVSASSAMLPAPNATESLARANALCPNAVAPLAVALLCCPNALLCTLVAWLSSPIAVVLEFFASAPEPRATEWFPVTKPPIAIELSAFPPWFASTFAPLPIAIELSAAAVLSAPIATALSPLALAPLPCAIESTPVAVLSSPNATEPFAVAKAW